MPGTHECWTRWCGLLCCDRKQKKWEEEGKGKNAIQRACFTVVLNFYKNLLSSFFVLHDKKDEYEMQEEEKDSDKAVLLKNEVEELCEECRAKVEHIVKEEGKQRLQDLQTVVSPFDGFAIIGNQLSSIPGVSSIRKIGSELPNNVQNLTRLGKRNRQDKLQPT